jgi:hypothetical protein
LDAERAALDFSLAASQAPNAADRDIESRLHAHWDGSEIVEIPGVISPLGYLNRWDDAMATQIEPGAVESGEKYLDVVGREASKHDQDGGTDGL